MDAAAPLWRSARGSPTCAERHAALGDPARLAIVDELLVSDRMPSELQALVELPSNLVAHHLDVLEWAGLINRTRSARSQLAAVLWHELTGAEASSAGTHPAEQVHPGAVAAARRAGLDLSEARPRSLDEVPRRPRLVVTVCDRAREEGVAEPGWAHWSVPDPVPLGKAAAFDATVIELRERITWLVEKAA